MGLNTNGTKLLLYARSLGVDFTKSATLGRQALRLASNSLRSDLSLFNYDVHDSEIRQFIQKQDRYAEGLFKLLGAETIHSFDCDDYEGASYRHDFNKPIAPEFKNQYSAFVDSGSLEHCFNFPTAIKNCMEMVAERGHFIGLTPANNFFGHGFYQFSPEIFFRIFSEVHGFTVTRMLLYEDRPDTKWYAVDDPAIVGPEKLFVNLMPLYLCVIAQKVQIRTIFADFPIQSAVLSDWQGRGGDGSRGSNVSSWRRFLPDTVKGPIKKLLYVRRAISKRAYEPRFREVKLFDK